LPKTAKYSQPYGVPLMIDFAWRTLKDFKKDGKYFKSSS